MNTLEIQKQIGNFYNQEQNEKRLIYRVLKILTISEKQAKTSKIDGIIYDMMMNGYITMTEQQWAELTKKTKTILFELQKIGYVASELQTESKAHYHARKNKYQESKPYAVSEWQSRFWKVIK